MHYLELKVLTSLCPNNKHKTQGKKSAAYSCTVGT